MLSSLRRVARIRRGSYVGLDAGELARAYATLEAGHLKEKYLRTAPVRPVNILGYQVNFLSYKSLRYLFEEIFLNQDYCFVADNEAPFILDCGSNIGTSILYFKKLYPRARIVGFEPFAQAFGVLQKNVTDNHLPEVTVHNIGLSGRIDERNFYFDPANPGRLLMSFVEGRIAGAASVVKTTPLSPFIDREVDFVKMDIEGSEMPVIQELCNTGKLSMIKQMAIEYHHHIDGGADALSDLLGLLERANFGYLIGSRFASPPVQGQFQDIMIRAYRKQPAA